MALTKTPIELSSTPGIVDNSNATAITIDSSENVGIGTSSPSSYFSPQLVVNSSVNLGGITIRSNATTDTNYLLFADGTSGNERYRGYVSYDHNTDTMKLATGASPAITIDSSGNLLVGKTSLNIGLTGQELRAGGSSYFTSSGDTALGLNRLSSDGTVLEIRKDNTIVGSIGAKGGTAYLIGSSKGLRVSGSGLIPVTTAGANSDATYDIGDPAVRFKDLYLSSGVVFGTTGGSVSSKTLDDYEEGTWTPVTGPTSSTATYAYRSGHYTKVGNLVTCTFGLKHNGGVWTSGEATISGLPFTADTTGAYQEPQFIVTSLGLAPTSQGGSTSSGAFTPGEVSFYLAGTQGRGRSYVSNADTPMGGNAVFATNSFLKATIIYHSS